MISSLPWTEIAELSLALLAGGLVTGFCAGLLGIGGGAIIVPVLYERDPGYREWEIRARRAGRATIRSVGVPGPKSFVVAIRVVS